MTAAPQRTYHVVGYTPEKVAVILSEEASLPECQNAGRVLLLMPEQGGDEARIRAKAALAREMLSRAGKIGVADA